MARVNHDCLVNTNGIWVLLPLSFKGRGAVLSFPFPFPLSILCYHQSLGLSPYTQYAGVGVAEGHPSSSVCCCSCYVTAHYIQPITSDSSLERAGQGHCGEQGMSQGFVNEVPCWEILL